MEPATNFKEMKAIAIVGDTQSPAEELELNQGSLEDILDA